MEQEQKREILKEILKSNSFITSKLNSKLLTYLVECEISNKTPSEYSIALDVFGKDSSFNPNEDTLIRVSVYNLRKKLERYYLNMGKRTKLRVKIPKGHYEVKFFNYSKENFRDKLKNPFFFLSTIIIILLSIITFLLIQYPTNAELKKSVITSSFADHVYSEFLTSNNPKLISLGDDFIYYSDFSEFNTTSIRKMYRNSNINREEEFEKFKLANPEIEDMKKLPFSFFNQAAVWPLPYLVKSLHDYDIDYVIKSATSLNSNDLKSTDIIFLGSFWTLGILDHVINDLGITYNIIGDETLSIRDVSNIDSTITFKRTGVPAFDHIDYCTFIKIPGPNNSTIFLFASFFATGSVGAIKYLTNENTLSELEASFEKEFDSLPKHFLIVFKSNGFNREVLSTELVKIMQIDPKSIAW
jgi:hypothetical protein